MSQTDMPEALVSASKDIWDEGSEEFILEPFLQRWGGYSAEILAQVLQDEDIQNYKTLALFALGYLAYPEAPSLLLPFSQSKVGSERWASTISLGRLKHELAFPLLQDLLLEGLQDPDLANDEDADWYMVQRFKVVLLLGDWGDRAAVPVLRKAFALCWNLEIQPGMRASGLEPYWWHPLQNCLAYALGRLRAWGALFTLQLPPGHLHIALLYLILGSLESTMDEKGSPRKTWGTEGEMANGSQPYSFASSEFQNLSPEDLRQLILHEFPRPINKQSDEVVIDFRYCHAISLDQVRRTLQERFGFSKEDQDAFLERVWQGYSQRWNEHYDYGPPSPPPDKDQLFLD
jgi:hypothetical protein